MANPTPAAPARKPAPPAAPKPQGSAPLARRRIPTAKPGDPPPFEQPGTLPTGTESNDPDNPEAPSQNEADAANPQSADPAEGNTTQPLGDTDPGKDSIDDEPGQALHENSAAGTGDLRSLLGSLTPLAAMVHPDAHEAAQSALRHLGDAERQATYGQHRSAAMSVGHAVQSLQRASDAEPDPGVRRALTSHAEAAAATGNQILAGEQRPPWNPLPSKSWKGIPFAEP